jgi:hypothetical protein
MAPAACAKPTLSLKKQVPRWISANAPVSDPAGSAAQANPLSPNVVTSLTGAVSGEADFRAVAQQAAEIPQAAAVDAHGLVQQVTVRRSAHGDRAGRHVPGAFRLFG